IRDCDVAAPGDRATVAAARSVPGALIARGNGRSYGDASFGPGLTLEMRCLALGDGIIHTEGPLMSERFRRSFRTQRSQIDRRTDFQV
ncbi:hypothetical protein, partial [Acinetobacter baumannii]|uniref:hypothetical protein n=1 Tax=Acinetobacter baumannii TaxID=470 RepID=UPI001C07F47F